MTGRKLNPDERILWGKVARSTRPMPGRDADVKALEAEIEAMLQAEQSQMAEKPAVVAEAATGVAAKPASGRHHPLERPVKRKIAKGRLPLEARIDLHGMVQSEAHALLHDFLVRAHERGMRHVLVITGKGSSLGSEGALKRAVPMWFAKPEFRFLISSFEPAAQKHGGDGALYVRIARSPGEVS